MKGVHPVVEFARRHLAMGGDEGHLGDLRAQELLHLGQVGDAGDPPVPGAKDLRGQLSPRQAAAVLARCGAMLGTVSWWAHLARAVECPSVLVRATGDCSPRSVYPCNVEVSLLDPTASDPVTLAAIVRRVAARPRQPLETASVDLSPGAMSVAA